MPTNVTQYTQARNKDYWLVTGSSLGNATWVISVNAFTNYYQPIALPNLTQTNQQHLARPRQPLAITHRQVMLVANQRASLEERNLSQTSMASYRYRSAGNTDAQESVHSQNAIMEHRVSTLRNNTLRGNNTGTFGNHTIQVKRTRTTTSKAKASDKLHRVTEITRYPRWTTTNSTIQQLHCQLDQLIQKRRTDFAQRSIL